VLGEQLFRLVFEEIHGSLSLGAFTSKVYA
jgi:hypothetical protein